MPRANTFAGAAIDRSAERRTDDRWLAEQISSPAARAVIASSDGPFLDCTSDPCRPALVPLAQLPDPIEVVLLGLDPEGPLFAVDVEGREDVPALGDGRSLMTLREAGTRVSQQDGGLLAYATAILNWHRRHRFCANCGTRTEPAEAGHVRKCPNCGAEHHPRTDPVVIMLVTDGDRALLGRNTRWPEKRYSALAGYVEPGESLEEAVAREVLEEAGVEIDRIEYRSSQPWPFPTSLMLGFRARYAGGEAHTNDAELEDVRWFTRAELSATVRGETEFHVPPPLAIARRLIDEWLEA